MDKYEIIIKDGKNFQCIYTREGKKQRIDWTSDHFCSLKEVFEIMAKAVDKCDNIGYDERVPGFEFQL